MRSLSLNELRHITGASFAEDVTTAAATVMVGSAISAVSGIIGYGVGGTVAALTAASGNQPYTISVRAATSFGRGLGVLFGPAVAGGQLLQTHPEYQTALIDKFHYYFG